MSDGCYLFGSAIAVDTLERFYWGLASTVRIATDLHGFGTHQFLLLCNIQVRSFYCVWKFSVVDKQAVSLTLGFLCFLRISLASTYVLSKLTVLHHSSLNCLRRMVAILATSLFFHKNMTLEATAGLLTSFFGFISFTYHRAVRSRAPPLKTKDSNV